MDCDRCRAYVSHVFKIYDVDGNEEWLCRNCLNDEHYCAAGGKTSQNPEDA